MKIINKIRDISKYMILVTVILMIQFCSVAEPPRSGENDPQSADYVEPVSGDVLDTNPPAQTTGLVATAGGESQINLVWSASYDNQTAQSNIVYEICKATASGGCNSFSVSQTTAPGTTATSVIGLNPLTTYYFRVRATDASGNIGLESSEATATTNPVGTVNSPAYSPSAGNYGTDQSVALSTSTTGAGICYTTNGANPACDAAASCTTGNIYSSAFGITSTSGNTTTTTIKAIGCLVGWTASPVSSATYTVDKTPPVAPTGLGGSASGAYSINLSWTAATDDTTSQGNIVYEICKATTSGGCDSFSVSQTTAPGTTATSVTGLSPLTTYYFRVRAKDEFSNVGTASTEALAITSPEGTVSSPAYSPSAGNYGTDQSVALSTSTTGAGICYTTNGANPACDAAASCTTGTEYSSAVGLTTTDGNSTTTTIKAIGCLIGWTASPVSSATYTVDKTPPGAPTGLGGSATGAYSINLSWTAATDDTTAQNNIVYEICKATASGGCNSFSVNQTTPPGTTTDIVTGLSPLTTYYFRVRAKDQASNVGAPSLEVSAVTDRIAGEQIIYTAGTITFNMRYVPPKSFPTGTNDLGGTATVSAGYLMAEKEVTYELWYAVKTWADSNSYSFANTGRPGNDGTAGTETTSQEPVTTINWRDAMVFSNALTEYYNAQNSTSLDCVYTTDAAYTTCIRTSTNNTGITYGTLGSEDDPYVNPNAKGFRLPTNDEWELAARYIDDTNSNGTLDAGEYYPGAYASGATADYTNATATGLVAWYSGNSSNVTHNVAAKTANALGLYDMSGNVWEWAFDWHPSYVGSYRVSRGGSYFNTAGYMRVGYVNFVIPYNLGNSFGFRLSRTP
ncbi:MAG: SUMF1/EgtB/PvdO family nonheme iron enzyme [Spirochaetia bacterium]|nr:SUMF1/EgtB/PvdO family nonheme iron enzyme [Spirochaetia bacterium]